MGCVMREEVDRLLLVIVCAGLESLKLALRLEVFAGLELEAGCDLKVPWISCTE